MATFKMQSMWGFTKHSAWMALLLGTIVLSTNTGTAQDEPASPARTREVLRQAIEMYKAKDYENAARYFSIVQPMNQTLAPAERDDFAKFSASNGIALKGRQDGAAQIRLAEDALQQGRTQEAGNLLKSLSANQYLNAAETKQLAVLNQRMQAQSNTVNAQAGKADAKALLTAGRAALKAGDLAAADSLANQADKASSLVPSWLQPWNDSPAKLRHDIQAARAKLPPATTPDMLPKAPEIAANDPNKTTSSSKFLNIWPFGGNSATPAKKEEDSSEKRVNEKMARQIVKDGFLFLQANDLEKAHFLAIKAKEMNVTFAAGEQTPDMLLHEVQRAKGITKPADPVTAKPKAVELPTSTDPRVLLKHGRDFLEKKKFDEADKMCTAALNANGRWGLFEDTPEKLRRDLQKYRQASEKDESVKLLVDARKLLTAGNLEEAEKKAYKAQQLHGPYGVFDFGDRPTKLIEEINRAKQARGPATPSDKQMLPKDVAAKDPPRAGIPFEVPASAQNGNKNRAIVMVREARELERQGMLYEARLKAFEARQLRASFLPEEDSPDGVLASLNAKCDRQIVSHLQKAVQHVSDPNDVQRFEKAQVQILAARKLAQAFELDTGRIEQTAHHLQQVATGTRPITTVGAIDLPAAQGTIDIPSGDPKKDQVRKAARERLAQAQLELSHGKTGQARKMAEELFNAEYGIQADVLKLIRSISAEEYNQQILEAKRNFDAGLDAFLQKDYNKAMFVFGSIDTQMLPEPYQARLRDIMSTSEMNLNKQLVQTKTQPSFIPGTKIEVPKGPTDPAANVGKVDLLDEVKAKDMVQFQMLRQRGQEAMRAAHEMFKQKQQDEAVQTLNDFIGQVQLAGLDPQKANELKRLPEARIQQYKTDIAEAKLRKISLTGQYASKWDEGKRQDEIRKHQQDMAEKMKIVGELMKQNKLKEAEVEVRKLREIDPDNVAVVAALHIINNKLQQEIYDNDVHRNNKDFLDLLPVGHGPIASMDNPVTFDKNRSMANRKRDESGSMSHELRNPKERAIEYRLRQPISLNFKNVPLEQALNNLTLLSGIQVVADKSALQQGKVNLDAPLSFQVEDISMKSALNLMLKEMRLTYTIENEVLLITTPENTIGRLVRVTYPIADLIVVVPDHPLPDVLNIQKAIERAMIPQGLYNNQYLTPPPFAFSPGEAVSSHSGGLGGAYASQGGNPNGPAAVHGAPTKDRSKEAMAEVLKELIQNTVAKNTWEAMGGNGSIQYFPFGMALVINQPQEVQEEVQLLLATLRKLQDLQVSVELRAVLVSESFFERIGVDFDMNISATKKAGNAALLQGDLGTAINKGAMSGLTSAGTLTPDLGFPIRQSSFNFTTPQFGGYQPEAGLSLGLAFLSEIQVFMFLEAVQGDRRAHIMQAPKLTVFNGQQATISGQALRPMTGPLVPASLANGQLIMTIPQPTFMPFGLTMIVQPVVSPDRRFVRLNVTPIMANGVQDPAAAIVVAFPNNNPAFFNNLNVQPPLPNGPLSVTAIPTTVNLNIVNTTVNVPDGGTVLLGGFKFLAEERTEYGPPVLSKIPYLSRLFRNVGWSRDSSTLIYLVTARIIMVQEEERIFVGEEQPIPGR